VERRQWAIRRANYLQDPISHGVTRNIIDHLEMISINEQEDKV
jgi:hypothetical protein